MEYIVAHFYIRFKVKKVSGNRNQISFYPFALREISVLTELILGHLRCPVEDVPPQPNSPPIAVSSCDPLPKKCCNQN